MLLIIKKVETANIFIILASYRRNSLSKTKHKTRLIRTSIMYLGDIVVLSQ